MTSQASGKTVSIVTPCYNAEAYIAETMRSVIGNTIFRDGRTRLQYFICDGGSTDRTTAIVEEIIAQTEQDNMRIELQSERDGGMYEALAKGLSQVTGDVCAYINAGDFYAPTAFEIVLEILERPAVKWLTGLRVRYNERSHLVSVKLPTRFRRTLCECGFYGRILPCIQQESTFWAGSLTGRINLAQLARYKLAGDAFIWRSFAEVEHLYAVHAWLGGFKVHRNQLSGQMDAYLAELRKVARPPSWLDYPVAWFDWLTSKMPDWFIRATCGASLFVFDSEEERYRRQGPLQ